MTSKVPKSVVGSREDGEPTDPLDHFYVCPACGQPVDKRDLGAVFHHEDKGHDRLPDDEAMRLLDVADRFRLKMMIGTAGQRPS